MNIPLKIMLIALVGLIIASSEMISAAGRDINTNIEVTTTITNTITNTLTATITTGDISAPTMFSIGIGKLGQVGDQKSFSIEPGKIKTLGTISEKEQSVIITLPAAKKDTTAYEFTPSQGELKDKPISILFENRGAQSGSIQIIFYRKLATERLWTEVGQIKISEKINGKPVKLQDVQFTCIITSNGTVKYDDPTFKEFLNDSIAQMTSRIKNLKADLRSLESKSDLNEEDSILLEQLTATHAKITHALEKLKEQKSAALDDQGRVQINLGKKKLTLNTK